MHTVALFCLVTVFAAAIVAVGAEPKGVDDWTPADTAAFFKKAGVNHELRALTAVVTKTGVTPIDMFDGCVNEKVLLELGVSSAPEQEKVLAAIEALDKRITESPSDFFEWRVANLRIFDTFMMPLVANAPRSLSLYVRFFMSEHVRDVLGPVDDVISDMNLGKFVAYTLFAPQMNILEAIWEYDIEEDRSFFLGYADSMVRYVLIINAIVPVVFFLWTAPILGFALAIQTYLKNVVILEILGVLSAFFQYYAGWYVIPIFAPIGWGYVFGACYGWNALYKKADRDGDGSIDENEAIVLLMQIGHSGGKMLGEPAVEGVRIAFIFAFLGGVFWGCCFIAGIDAREIVLGCNFFVAIWILPLFALYTFYLSTKLTNAVLAVAKNKFKLF